MCIHIAEVRRNMMKRHRQFELFAGNILDNQGFTNIDVTRGVTDRGTDAFCERK